MFLRTEQISTPLKIPPYFLLGKNFPKKLTNSPISQQHLVVSKDFSLLKATMLEILPSFTMLSSTITATLNSLNLFFVKMN